MKRSQIIEQFRRDGHRPVLLVVDDQPLNIRALNEVFKDDYEVLMATNGASALQKAHEQHPDIILLDIVMPGMDGYEVCRLLSEDAATADIPVIFLTSETDAGVEARGFEVGAVDFISKPYHPLIVRARVQTHLILKLQMDFMRNIATQDGLTGLSNRRRFDEALEQCWRLCARENRPLSLLMTDVDYFKRYNDSYGHLAGDDCLRQVARMLKKSLRRPTDIACRYGGEEFACLLPYTDAAGAQACADAILQAVRQATLAHKSSDVAAYVTLSIGVATLWPGAEGQPSRLVLHADEALYQSKQQGRDRYTVFPFDGSAASAAG